MEKAGSNSISIVHAGREVESAQHQGHGGETWWEWRGDDVAGHYGPSPSHGSLSLPQTGAYARKHGANTAKAQSRAQEPAVAQRCRPASTRACHAGGSLARREGLCLASPKWTARERGGVRPEAAVGPKGGWGNDPRLRRAGQLGRS